MDPVGWGTCTGYVGKTRQRPWTRRIEQHRENQPWGDEIIDAWPIYQSEWVSDLGLVWREWWHIRLRRPPYNYQWNSKNSRRVPRWEAERRRVARDAEPAVPRQGVIGVRAFAGVVMLLAGVLVLLVAGVALV